MSVVRAQAELTPLKPAIQRPEVLTYSDSYIYGPASGFGSEPQIVTTIASFEGEEDQVVTLYVYWLDRLSGGRQYYNVRDGGGFRSQEVDVFGRPRRPVKLFVPQFEDLTLFGPGSLLGSFDELLPGGPGQYAVAIEIRDPIGFEVLARDVALYSEVEDVLVVPGGDLATQTWTADKAYYLGGTITVPDGETLSVEAGTVVLAGPGASLVVESGATLRADGAANHPIVFSPDKIRDLRRRGDWGGVIVRGAAPANPDIVGGDDPTDSSGVLRFVRIEHAGDNDQFAGLELEAVGSGTILDHVQVLGGFLHGIWVVGGTARLERVIAYNVFADAFAWDSGWTGSGHELCLLPTTLGRLIDGTSFPSPEAEPRSAPDLTALLMVAEPEAGENGILIRDGSAVTLTRAAILDTGAEAVRIEGASSQALIGSLIQFNDVLVENAEAISNVPLEGVVEGEAFLANPRSLLHPDLVPLLGDNSCTTQVDDWTQAPWINWDRGPY